MDEQRRMRQRIADLEAYNDRTASTPNDCDVAVLCQTGTDGSYPTAANVVYKCLSGDLNGEETEGSPATFVPDGGTYYAVNNGTGIPPMGTTVTVIVSSGKASFRFDS